MTYELPTSLEIGGTDYEIRTDFREVLDVMGILNDADLSGMERGYLTLLFFYPDFPQMPREHHQDALGKCYWFINGGKDEKKTGTSVRLMDWEQDFPYIIAPINRVIGHEVRSDKYLHWWTFLAAYMEIGECTFSNIVHIRDLKHRGKKMDAADKEWYMRNRDLVDLKTKYTSADEEMLKKWGGG